MKQFKLCLLKMSIFSRKMHNGFIEYILGIDLHPSTSRSVTLYMLQKQLQWHCMTLLSSNVKWCVQACVLF